MYAREVPCTSHTHTLGNKQTESEEQGALEAARGRSKLPKETRAPPEEEAHQADSHNVKDHAPFCTVEGIALVAISRVCLAVGCYSLFFLCENLAYLKII